VTAQQIWLAAVDQRFAKIEGDLKRLTRMVGANLTATVAAIFMLVAFG
jgi:hypothetical protein